MIRPSMTSVLSKRAAYIFIWAILSSTLGAQQAPMSGREQLKQYIAQLQNEPSNRQLREKIITLVGTMRPKPSVPDAAVEREGAAEYLFKKAQSEADFAKAVKEYEAALLICPWSSGTYFNLGVAAEKANLPKKAIDAFELYLLATPEAKDGTDVRKRIGAMKLVAIEQQERETAETRQQALETARVAEAADRRSRLEARFRPWIGRWHYVWDDGRRACCIDFKFGAGGDLRIEATEDLDHYDFGEFAASATEFKFMRRNIDNSGRGYIVHQCRLTAPTRCEGSKRDSTLPGRTFTFGMERQ